MLFKAGLALLFFLPVIESFNRTLGFDLLLISAAFMALHTVKRGNLIRDKIDYLWIMLLTVFAVSTIFSWSLSRSYTELTRYIAYFLIFVSIRNYADKEKMIKYFFLPSVVVNSMILSILSALYSLPFLPLPVIFDGMNLFYPTFGHNRIADLLIFSIPVSIAIYLYQEKVGNKQRNFFFLLSILLILMLVISQGRGVMLSLSFAFLLLILLKKNQADIVTKYFRWVIGITLLSITFLSISFIYSNLTVKQDDYKHIVKGLYKPAKNELRFEYFRQALKGVSFSPIFGTGLDTFRYLSRMYQIKPSIWTWYAHSHYLELFAETGISGGILFLSLIVILFIKSLKCLHYPQEDNLPSHVEFTSIALFIALLASSLHSFIDYDWHYLSVFLYLWIIFALFNFPFKKLDNKNRPFHRIFLLIILLSFSIKFLFPLDSNETIKRADLYLKNNDWISAMTILQRAYQLDKANSDLILKISKLYSAERRNEEANYWYNKAILLYPKEEKFFFY